jgi:adenosylhomocysteine nucleosidase
MSRVAFVAALPRELAMVTLGWSRQPLMLGSRESSVAWSDEAIAIAAGMGGPNAVRALDTLQNSEPAKSLGPISAVVSVGFAGGLTAQSHVGQIFRPSTFLDVRTGERYLAAEGDGSLCITAPVVASKQEKARLAKTYGAQLVDMEAASLARMCAAQGLPFYAFKSISDAAEFELPALGKFATPEGGFRTAAFAFHVAVRPMLWGPAIELGRNARIAQVTLAAALRGWLASSPR